MRALVQNARTESRSALESTPVAWLIGPFGAAERDAPAAGVVMANRALAVANIPAALRARVRCMNASELAFRVWARRPHPATVGAVGLCALRRGSARETPSGNP